MEWLVRRFCEKWGKGATYGIDRGEHPHEAHYLKLDISKAKTALGWCPLWDLPTAIDRVVDWTRCYREGADCREECLRQIRDYASAPGEAAGGLMAIVCRYCGGGNTFRFLDLGLQPLANRFLRDLAAEAPAERKYPLDVHWCETCGLVQVGCVIPPEDIFNDNYIYFSATSDLVHRHARFLARSFRERFGLGPSSLVVEVASNDGTVLKPFREYGDPRPRGGAGFQRRTGRHRRGDRDGRGFLPRGVGTRDPGNAWPGRRHPCAPRLRPRPRDPRVRPRAETSVGAFRSA